MKLFQNLLLWVFISVYWCVCLCVRDDEWDSVASQSESAFPCQMLDHTPACYHHVYSLLSKCQAVDQNQFDRLHCHPHSHPILCLLPSPQIKHSPIHRHIQVQTHYRCQRKFRLPPALLSNITVPSQKYSNTPGESVCRTSSVSRVHSLWLFGEGKRLPSLATTKPKVVVRTSAARLRDAWLELHERAPLVCGTKWVKSHPKDYRV